MVSIAEVYAHLSIECPSGFLQAEVVVQLLVRKVPALEREVVASATETVGKAQVVGELARNHVVALVRTDFGRIIGKAVQVLVVIRYGQRIAFFPEVAPVEGHVGIGKFRYKSRFICQWDMKKSRPPLSLWRGGLSV